MDCINISICGIQVGLYLFIFVDFKSLKHFHGPLKELGPVPIVPVDMGALLVETGICRRQP